MTLTDPSKLFVPEESQEKTHFSASGEGGLLLFPGSETSKALVNSRDLKIQKALPSLIWGWGGVMRGRSQFNITLMFFL